MALPIGFWLGYLSIIMRLKRDFVSHIFWLIKHKVVFEYSMIHNAECVKVTKLFMDKEIVSAVQRVIHELPLQTNTA